MNNNIRVGIIRWDSYVDSTLYHSYYGAKVLSPKHYHNRVPFFGQIDDNGQVTFPHYTEDVFNKELAFALDAGIDYFIYFYYSSVPTQSDNERLPKLTTDLSGKPCHELKLVHRIHSNSPYRQKMNYCFHLSNNLLNDEDIEILCNEFFFCNPLPATMAVPLSCFRVNGKRWSLLRVEGAARIQLISRRFRERHHVLVKCCQANPPPDSFRATALSRRPVR